MFTRHTMKAEYVVLSTAATRTVWIECYVEINWDIGRAHGCFSNNKATFLLIKNNAIKIKDKHHN